MKSHKCIFTFVWNEPVFMQVWINYYSKYFSDSEIYILHAIKERECVFDDWLKWSCDLWNVNRIEIPDGEDYEFEKVAETVRNMQKKLLNNYEYVLYTDVDEIVWHPNGIDNYINNASFDSVSCNGFEVVQKLGEEPDLDLSRPIMEQRRWWCPSPKMYSKPLLSRVPLDWCWGFHYLNHVPKPPVDSNLILMHLHKVDFKICLERNISRLKNDQELANTMEITPGFQNTLGERCLLSFWGNSIDDGQPVTLVEIPEHIRKALL